MLLWMSLADRHIWAAQSEFQMGFSSFWVSCTRKPSLCMLPQTSCVILPKTLLDSSILCNRYRYRLKISHTLKCVWFTLHNKIFSLFACCQWFNSENVESLEIFRGKNMDVEMRPFIELQMVGDHSGYFHNSSLGKKKKKKKKVIKISFRNCRLLLPDF